MQRKKIILIGMFIFTMAVFGWTNAFSVPALINYQGRLTDSGGQPKAGQFPMRFRIYDSPTGGNFKWGEKQESVKVNNGIFNVLIGSGTPIGASDDTPPYDTNLHPDKFKDTFEGGNLWLEVQVDPDAPMQPRQQMASVGQSFVAGQLEGNPNFKIRYGRVLVDAPVNPNACAFVTTINFGYTFSTPPIVLITGHPHTSNDSMYMTYSTWNNDTPTSSAMVSACNKLMESSARSHHDFNWMAIGE